MRRPIFTIVSALSLLLLLAAAGYWATSYSLARNIGGHVVTHPDGSIEIWRAISARGSITFVWMKAERPEAVPTYKWDAHHDPGLPGWTREFGHVQGALRNQQTLSRCDFQSWWIPDWFVCMAFAVLPSWWERSRRRHHGPGFPVLPPKQDVRG